MSTGADSLTASKVVLLAGISNILASFAGFLMGSVLIAASVALPSGSNRRMAAAVAPIALAMGVFVSLRTILAYLYPPIIYYLFPGQALMGLAAPSPLIALLGDAIAPCSGCGLVSTVEFGFNVAALILNFAGLGTMIWKWNHLLLADVGEFPPARPGSMKP